MDEQHAAHPCNTPGMLASMDMGTGQAVYQDKLLSYIYSLALLIYVTGVCMT